MDKGFVILTEIELEKLCGNFFDRGYYSAFHKSDRIDRSIELFEYCKTEFLKDILERSKNPEQEIKTPKPDIKESSQKTYLNEPRQIVLNQGTCKSCGDHLVSHHRHDYVSCSCDKSFLDGGTDYVRSGGNIETNTIYSDDDFKIVRNSAERGGRGKNGNEPFSYTKICDMSDEWLESVLKYGGAKWHLDIIRKELEFRNPTLRSFRIGDNIEYKDVQFRLISNYYPDTMMFDTDHPIVKTIGYTDLVEYGKII